MKPTPNYDMYIDGASRGNPGPAAVGVLILNGADRPVRQFGKYLGQTTNNVAEYLALIYGLQEALRLNVASIAVKTDSELLARQINGQYRVRDAQLRLFYDLAMELLRGFQRSTVEHIPRELNRQADRLAAEAIRQAGLSL